MCMTTAAIVGTVAVVGTEVYKAKTASDAQEHAADTQAKASTEATIAQEKAAEEALQFQKQRYNDTLRATADYTNMGAGALAKLGAGLGVTPGNVAPSPLGLDRQNGVTTSGMLSPEDFAAFNAARQNPTGFNLTPEQKAIDAQNPASTANLSQSGVRMQSPDGKETQVVSREKVPFYLQQGAKVIQ